MSFVGVTTLTLSKILGAAVSDVPPVDSPELEELVSAVSPELLEPDELLSLDAQPTVMIVTTKRKIAPIRLEIAINMLNETSVKTAF